jgi:hypothetical protein
MIPQYGDFEARAVVKLGGRRHTLPIGRPSETCHAHVQARDESTACSNLLHDPDTV